MREYTFFSKFKGFVVSRIIDLDKGVRGNVFIIWDGHPSLEDLKGVILLSNI